MSVAVAPHPAAAPPLVGGPLDWLALRLSLDLRILSMWREQGGDMAHPGWAAVFAVWRDRDDKARALLAERASLTERLASDPEAAMLRRIVKVFALDPSETEFLETCLALHAVPMLAEEIGAAYGRTGTAFASERLQVDLKGGEYEAIVRPSSPLLFWSIVRAGPVSSAFGQTYTVDPGIAAAVAGKPGLDATLAGYAETVDPDELPIRGWGVEEWAAGIAPRLAQVGLARIEIVASKGRGGHIFTSQLAARLGVRLLAVRPPEGSGDEFARRAHRIALITGQALFWPDASGPAQTEIAGVPVQFVCREPHLPILPSQFYRTIRIDVPEPTLADRKACWLQVAGKETLPSDARLAGLGIGELVNAARMAPTSAEQASLDLSTLLGTRLGSSCVTLSTPYDWDDLILSRRQREALDRLVAEVGMRDRLLGDRVLRERYGSLGQSAMFWGDPGTGKTMSAQIIAKALGTDCVRVDTGTIISKYIGETQSRLRDLFAQLEGTRVVLLFDEADGLFAKRTDIQDAHDKHANADTNYLLQQIERFDGLAILATNKKDNIDPAFARRLRHIVDFKLPGASERALLWERHLAALSRSGRRSEEQIELARKLAGVDLSPSQIKSAALSAAYARLEQDAATLSLGALVAGIERELSKEGRGLDRNQRKELVRNG